MKHFQHDKALVETEHIGERTRIWAFAHILPGAVIGTDCNICDHTFIENDVLLGDRVTVKCGVSLWDGMRIEDDVFIGPSAVFCNDRFPRSRCHDSPLLRTIVEKGASIGAGAVLLPGIRIGRYAMVGAGAVVTSDVPAYAIVVGNPAAIIGYCETEKFGFKDATGGGCDMPKATTGKLAPSNSGASIHTTKLIRDLRGNLIAWEHPKDLPFTPQRTFIVYDVPSRKVRGAHAHRTLHQFLVVLRGSINILVDNGSHRDDFLLDSPDTGLHIPPKTWAIQYNHSRDAMLLVMASAQYDAADYIREYDDFLEYINPNTRKT
ncbi:MAG: WxcM-like domain-containing protein [Bdellovibrionota bacterium]|nr:MAG: WxcM-like domain-containing protein [Bdellovibrionota bacterium]